MTPPYAYLVMAALNTLLDLLKSNPALVFILYPDQLVSQLELPIGRTAGDNQVNDVLILRGISRKTHTDIGSPPRDVIRAEVLVPLIDFLLINNLLNGILDYLNI
jgi:hypothetical protein